VRLRLVLIGDGPSDDVLLHPIRWSLRQQVPEVELLESPFVFRRHRPVAEVIQEAMEAWRPDLVVVHRDTEREDPEVRRREIPYADSVVPLVPVRMTEAWLLLDESAIRRAVSRPRATNDLQLPRLRQLEARPNPKADLETALLLAAGDPTGRARRRVQDDLSMLKRRVAENIDDYTPLRNLTAFQRWEEDLAAALAGRLR
jgi:hypothetical protein